MQDLNSLSLCCVKFPPFKIWICLSWYSTHGKKRTSILIIEREDDERKNVRVYCLVIFFLLANQAWTADWIYLIQLIWEVIMIKIALKNKGKESIISVGLNILSEKQRTKIFFNSQPEITKAPDNPSMLCYYTKLYKKIDCVNEKIKDLCDYLWMKKVDVIIRHRKGSLVIGMNHSISVVKRLKNIVCKGNLLLRRNAVVASPRLRKPVAPRRLLLLQS